MTQYSLVHENIRFQVSGQAKNMVVIQSWVFKMETQGGVGEGHQTDHRVEAYI